MAGACMRAPSCILWNWVICYLSCVWNIMYIDLRVCESLSKEKKRDREIEKLVLMFSADLELSWNDSRYLNIVQLGFATLRVPQCCKAELCILFSPNHDSNQPLKYHLRTPYKTIRRNRKKIWRGQKEREIKVLDRDLGEKTDSG